MRPEGGKGLNGVREGRERDRRGRRPRSLEQQMDRANGNWSRSQSCLRLTVHSVMPLSPPLSPPHTLTTSSKPSCPCHPHVPSRSPGAPPAASSALQLSFISHLQQFHFPSFMTQTPTFPTSFPCPWNLSFTPHIILIPHT